jgi:hypothetical protein
MSLHLSSLDGYLHVALSGILNKELLLEAETEVAHVENACAKVPHRLVDLTDVSAVELNFHDLWSLAERRRVRPLVNPIKFAIVAPHPVQIGCARMYQRMAERPRITIAIFNDVTAAREWLFSAQIMDPEMTTQLAMQAAVETLLKFKPPIRSRSGSATQGLRQ